MLPVLGPWLYTLSNSSQKLHTNFFLLWISGLLWFYRFLKTSDFELLFPNDFLIVDSFSSALQVASSEEREGEENFLASFL